LSSYNHRICGVKERVEGGFSQYITNIPNKGGYVLMPADVLKGIKMDKGLFLLLYLHFLMRSGKIDTNGLASFIQSFIPFLCRFPETNQGTVELPGKTGNVIDGFNQFLYACRKLSVMLFFFVPSDVTEAFNDASFPEEPLNGSSLRPFFVNLGLDMQPNISTVCTVGICPSLSDVLDPSDTVAPTQHYLDRSGVLKFNFLWQPLGG